MTNSSNDLALALLATLEAQARKKGRKSIAKRVAHRLRKAGASDTLVSDVEALSAKSVALAPKKSVRTTAPKAKSKQPAGERLPT